MRTSVKSLKPHPFRKRFLWQLLAALSGLAISVYLLVHHTRLESGIQESASFCSLGGFADCDVVNVSRYSEIFGIPIAALGAVYFFFLLILGLLAPPQDPGFRFSQKLMGWLTATATVYNLILFFFIQIIILKSFCLFCFVTYLCTGAHFYLSFKMFESQEMDWRLCLRSFILDKLEVSYKVIPNMRWSFAGVSLLAFIGLISFLPSFIRQKSSTYTFVDGTIEQFYLQWKEKPIKRLETKSTDGNFGNPDSKIQIVAYSDFECPFCRKAAFTLHTVLKPLSKKVHFIFKNFPLDSTCNPGLSYQLHAHACKLARLAFCANQKGKFWQLHDTLFLRMNDEDLKEGFDAISDRLSSVLSKEEIKDCLANPKSLENTAEDIQSATKLNIRGTPTVFINGKQITIPLTVETLNKLIALEESIP